MKRVRIRHGSVVRSSSRKGPREPNGFRFTKPTPVLLLDDPLHALRKARGKGAAALYFLEMVATYRAFAKGLCQYVGCSDRILNGQIDTDASHWGLRMGCIADAQNRADTTSAADLP
jgi:hypothetical protein